MTRENLKNQVNSKIFNDELSEEEMMCEINGKGLCDYSEKLGLCPRCDTDAYSR
tara:strand:+ start:315 stop:476 length:162 start_codon:yes stop_codon:yes gene_type:complete